MFTPTTKPTQPATGQIYFDSKAKQLEIYNGKKFITLQGGGNTYVTNNDSVTDVDGAITNEAKLTKVTIVTNVSGEGGADGSARTSGHIAIFTAANTLGNSVITQASNKSNGGYRKRCRSDDYPGW